MSHTWRDCLCCHTFQIHTATLNQPKWLFDCVRLQLKKEGRFKGSAVVRWLGGGETDYNVWQIKVIFTFLLSLEDRPHVWF